MKGFHIPGSRGDAIQVKLAQQVAILGHGSLSLKDLDGDSSLLILIGGECLTLLSRDSCTPWNELSHDSTNSLNAQTQGSQIKEKDICSPKAKSVWNTHELQLRFDIHSNGHQHKLGTCRKSYAHHHTPTFDLISTLATENTTLDSCSIGNSFIGIHSLAWLLPIEVVLEELLNLWNSATIMICQELGHEGNEDSKV